MCSGPPSRQGPTGELANRPAGGSPGRGVLSGRHPVGGRVTDARQSTPRGQPFGLAHSRIGGLPSLRCCPPCRMGFVTSLPDLERLPTPALIIDADLLDANLRTMCARLPGSGLRPHVKAHKCTQLARRQYQLGHHGFTCATIREVEGMVAAGLGEDLLLANEVLDATRLGPLIRAGAGVTVAVDSPATIRAAAAGGVVDVLIDVNVGLPRCGCDPGEAAALAQEARSLGLEVRGVMGYEGHAVGIEDRGGGRNWSRRAWPSSQVPTRWWEDRSVRVAAPEVGTSTRWLRRFRPAPTH